MGWFSLFSPGPGHLRVTVQRPRKRSWANQRQMAQLATVKDSSGDFGSEARHLIMLLTYGREH
jgi:hypothetical protein